MGAVFYNTALDRAASVSRKEQFAHLLISAPRPIFIGAKIQNQAGHDLSGAKHVVDRRCLLRAAALGRAKD